MDNYLDLMRDILENGDVVTNERTGTGTISVFGRQLRFDLKNGQLPLVSTKKVFTRGIIEELLWFLRGSTSNVELEERKVGIWDEWALTEDVVVRQQLPDFVRATLLAEKLELTHGVAIAMLTHGDTDGVKGYDLLTKHEIPTEQDVVIAPRGSLGPIYGKQWRGWQTPDGRRIDQIAEVIEQLKTKPGSRRLIVTAWNPADLPDETKSPQQNAIDGRMALAACHCLFQFRTRQLSLQERYALWIKRNSTETSAPAAFEDHNPNALDKFLNETGLPKYALSCQLYQRSADYFLGAPFNIASYAILTAMIAQVVNMVPDEFIWTGGDVHLYSNHIEQVKEQLSRTPYPLPQLKLNPEIKNIDDFKIEDIQVVGYESHPAIKAPVSV